MLSFPLENLKNKGRGIFRISPYFFVLAIIFSVTLALLFLNSFRAYKSDISILIIPKNESASFQADQIMENLSDITHRLSFYDRVLYDNPEIADPFAGLSKDERKTRWNESFSIERLPSSTTLNISVFNSDRAEGNKIARQVALSLSEVASKFYNIQTDLDFRIIEGPISSSYIQSIHWLIVLSLLGGIFLAYLVALVFNLFSLNLKKKVKSNFNWDAIGIEKKKVSPAQKHFAPAPSQSRRASAPSNLPIAEEKAEEKAEIFPALEEKIPAEKGEPTDDEYRERLNKLLRGEI